MTDLELLEIKKKFADVGIDPDTKIILEKYLKVGDYDAKIEYWFWDGIYAFSLIFLKADVEHLEQSNLIKLIKEEISLTADFSISGTGKYLFLSYGYRSG
ncbi:hypothetical protein JEZ13_09375 [bacterium]|nr:hypothetical protein [bacterium]